MNYYFCDNNEHTKQVFTDKDSPRCNICGGVMTYGRFTGEFINGTIIKPGAHKDLDGNEYYIPTRYVSVY